MKGKLQLNLSNIHLKKNFDSIELLQEVIPSIFKNEIYWCSMVYETRDICSKTPVTIDSPLSEILKNKYALRFPGREEIKHYSIYPGLNINRGEKKNIIEYSAPGKEIWRGDLTDDSILRFHIWIMERDSDPKKIDSMVSKFSQELNYENLEKVISLLREKKILKMQGNHVIHSMMSFITRIGASILREDKDDLVAAYTGSLIGYNFRDPLEHHLDKESAGISLHLDRYEENGELLSKEEGEPGCIILDFGSSSNQGVYFDKLYEKLEKSLKRIRNEN